MQNFKFIIAILKYRNIEQKTDMSIETIGVISLRQSSEQMVEAVIIWLESENMCNIITQTHIDFTVRSLNCL